MPPTQNRYARPFIPLLLSLMVGITFGGYFAGPATRLLAIFLTLASSAAAAACTLRHRSCRYIPLVLFAGLGCLSILPWSDPRFPDHHVVHFVDGPKWNIVGIVHSRPRRLPNRTRFILQVQRLGNGQTDRRASGLLRVTAVGTEVDLHRGDRIQLTSRIRSIRNFGNPGAFDYRRYMAFQKIWATAYSPAEKVRLLDRPDVSGSLGSIDAARDRVEDLIDGIGEGAHRDVLQALILGDRSRITPHLREAFHRSGVGHLLAISGLHIGIVAGGAFVALVFVLSHWELLLWTAWVKKAAAIGAFIPALLYALLAGMSPSTQRALAMVGVFLLTFLLERQQDSINTLSVAALLILLFHPPALASISFQLSFTAVFFIIVGLSRIRPAADGPHISFGRRLRRKLVDFFTVTVAATIGTLPLVMLYFQQVSLIGILSNFVFIPLIGFAVVPLGLLSVLVMWISPTLASWGLQLAGGLLKIGIEGIELLAAQPFAAVDTFIPSHFEIGCYYLLLAAALAMVRRGGEAGATSGMGQAANVSAAAGDDREGRRLYYRLPVRSPWIAVVMALAVLGLLADAGYWVYQRFWRSDLRVTVVDVGQGSAALLQLPGGSCMLADGGGFPDSSVFDVGELVLAPLLRRKKILAVETLILSHPNSDHLNGLIYIADRFSVQQIWTNSEERNTIGYRRLKEVIDRRNIREVSFSTLLRSRRMAGAHFQVLHPPADYLLDNERKYRRETNDNSLVFKISLGSVSFLFPGDITARAEKELLVQAGSRLKASVLLVPHHGSRSSSSKNFVEAVCPQIAIVSSGWQNRFGFPHAEVLQRLERRNVRIYRTDHDGAIELVTDGRQLKVSPWIERKRGHENG